MALNSIFRREDFEKMTFDALLHGIVPEKTLRTAMDYVALLWGERVNEKLVKTINPLNEVEVHFDSRHGGFDTHFLEFDFNRVKSDGSLSHLLVTVNDVTKRVDAVARAAGIAGKGAGAARPAAAHPARRAGQLTGFLTKPKCREDGELHPQGAGARRIGVPRQDRRHLPPGSRVKGEAAALGLKTVETARAQLRRSAAANCSGRQTL